MDSCKLLLTCMPMQWLADATVQLPGVPSCPVSRLCWGPTAWPVLPPDWQLPVPQLGVGWEQEEGLELGQEQFAVSPSQPATAQGMS